jgi:hypothetical protein
VQQRQLRLGDILDDYCPRERRVTNHVIVAMIADDVKQVRCTTCDADHEFKHAKVPRQRRKTETPAALYAQVLATGPKRVAHDPPPAHAGAAASDTDEQDVAQADGPDEGADEDAIEMPAVIAAAADPVEHAVAADADDNDNDEDPDDSAGNRAEEDGPIHRRLIRASLPKIDGAPPPTRAIPEFTIRQPAGRPGANRFRGPRPPRGGPGGGPGGGGQQFPGNRTGGGGNMHGGPRGAGGMRSNGGRPPQGPGGAQMRRNGPGRKRSR